MRTCKLLLTGSLALIVSSAAMVLPLVGPAGAANAPTLHITSGPYHNGQAISISVGPNHYFKPYHKINVLECADKKGKHSNLPLNDTTCDGNTVQGNTILIAKNGSFVEHGYVVYSLPNSAALGEYTGGEPICNATHTCVFYVGEDQGNFTWPKMFSSPFVVNSGRKAKG
jgi:hypothetical protein